MISCNNACLSGLYLIPLPSSSAHLEPNPQNSHDDDTEAAPEAAAPAPAAALPAPVG